MQLKDRCAGIKVKGLFRFTSAALVVFSILIFSKTAGAPSVYAEITEDPDFQVVMPSSGNADIDSFILESAAKHGVDPKLVYYVIRQESDFKLNARSGKNAQGLMQMIPATAERFGVKNPYDPRQNIEGGVRYLRWLLKEFKGDVRLALAGYNAGEGAVKKHGYKIPDYKETKNYVRKIVGAYAKTHHPVLEPEEAQQEFGLVAAE